MTRWPLFQSCLLIRFEEEKYIVDCGGSIPMALKEHNIKWEDLSGVILSHMHGGHVNGLDELIFFRYHMGKKLTVFLTPNMTADFFRRFGHVRYQSTGMVPITEVVDIQMCSSMSLKCCYENEIIRFVPVPHVGSLPTHGFWFEYARIFYAPDMLYDERILSLYAEKANQMIIGCHRNKHPAHFSMEDIRRIPERCQPKFKYTHYEKLPGRGEAIKWLEQGSIIYRSR